MQSICVFCGSGLGRNPIYKEKAIVLGELLAKKNITLVYGGGRIGLMGVLADTVLANKGRVIGVIPHALEVKEVAHRFLTELHVVDSMHTRKAMMAKLSDAFIALPGGFGTLEELFEIITWAQLGIHAKPCGLLNIAGYYDALIKQLDVAVAEEFIRGDNLRLLCTGDDPLAMLELLNKYRYLPYNHLMNVREI